MKKLVATLFTTLLIVACGEQNPDKRRAVKEVTAEMQSKKLPEYKADLSAIEATFQRMIDDLVAYEFLPFVTPGGAYDLQEGEKFPGFYTDDASVWAVVKPTFCQ